MDGGAAEPHILLITLGFPPAIGGIQSCLYERARLAAGRIVVLAPAHPAARSFDAAQPFPIYRWPAFLGQTPGLKRLAQLVFSLVYTLRLYRRYPIRRLECGQALPLAATAWFLWVIGRVPYAVWAFGDDIIKPARSRWLHWLLLAVLRPARRLLAVSHFTRRLLLELGLPDEQIEVLYPPLNVQAFALQEPPQRPTLLTVCRLVPRKGVAGIIRLLPALLEDYPTLSLHIVGEGPARVDLSALARRLGVAERVVFRGAVPAEELATVYAGCDLFVLLPTPDAGRGEAEGLGIVYLEAAASGRPSLGWRTGGVEEAIVDGQTGRLVNDGDLAGARAAIAELLAHPVALRAMGRRARSWVEVLAARSADQLAALDEAR